MLKITTKSGIPCNVPENINEDCAPRFRLPLQEKEASLYYKDHGYVVISNAIEQSDCDLLREAWNIEVRSKNPLIYRQTSGILERNLYNKQGYIINPALNLQSLNPQTLPKLRLSFEKVVCQSTKLARFVSILIGDNPRIVQSMYFEGNTTTQEHQDSFYLDDEQIGRLTAMWIALEDIDANAGRFFVAPKTHLSDYSEVDSGNNIANSHNKYIQKIVEALQKTNEQLHAPCMRKGDVLFWNSLTIHGSLTSARRASSRSSITVHVIRTGARFRVTRNSIRLISGDRFKNGFEVFRPRDQAKIRYRLELFLASISPDAYNLLKKLALLMLLRFNSLKR